MKPQRELKDSLQALISAYGMSAVRRSLSEIQSSTKPKPRTKKSQQNPKRRPSAVKRVSRMNLSPEQTEAIRRAAEMFDEKAFLPSLPDVKEFAEVYGFDLPKSVTRASSIPRVFSFIASMDTDVITKILDKGRFSGPASLGPIADAIRRSSASRHKFSVNSARRVVDTSSA